MEIKVLFLPNWSKNPFQTLLSEHLKKHNISVLGPNVREIEGDSNSLVIIHLHWIFSFIKRKYFLNSLLAFALFFIKILFLKVRRVGLCWTMHNILPHENNFPRLNYAINFIMLRFIPEIIVMSDWQEHEIRRIFRLGRKRISVIPHGNYIGYYGKSCSREEARDYLKIPHDKFVYLSFGLIKEYKNIGRLIKIFRKNSLRNDLLIVAGEFYKDPLEEEILCSKNRNIKTYLKFIPKDEVRFFFSACDVFVAPFKAITNSGSVLLAMSFGKPVICPDKGSLSEVVDNDCGILYVEDELDKALVEIRKMDLKKMGNYSFNKASSYNWDLIAEQYRKVYLDCMAGKS